MWGISSFMVTLDKRIPMEDGLRHWTADAQRGSGGAVDRIASSKKEDAQVCAARCIEAERHQRHAAMTFDILFIWKHVPHAAGWCEGVSALLTAGQRLIER